ncbi:MAG: hypothetical protein H7X80_09785 [bacterium]|nr:hypothetical protein [Candidatus Kapabacteria bacterium]
MHLSKTIIALGCTVGMLAVNIAYGQTSGGSSYSIFNIGDLRQTVTASGAARGGIEAAVPSPLTINGTNPALWGDLRNVSVQAGMSFTQYQVSDAEGSLNQNRTSLQNFSAGFPVSEKFRSTIAIGLRPYSSVNYRTQLAENVPNANGDSTEARITYTGVGGISEFVFGGSFAPIPEVAVGVGASRFFGAINNGSGVTFPDGALNPAVYQRNDFYGGWGVRAGLSLKPVDQLTIGAVFETGSTLFRDRTEIAAYIDGFDEVIDTTAKRTENFTIPPRISVGASFLTGRALISTQATMQSWSSDVYPNARNSMRVALGFDRIGAEAPGAAAFDKWTLRAGAYYDQTYYNINGNGINEMAVTIGAAIPITIVSRLNVGTTFDIALEVGQRGTTDNGLTSELFGRFNVEFTLGELWFVRSRR